MILTPAQRKALERTLATAKAEEERIAFMEQLATAAPTYAERVAAHRQRQQYLINLATIALAADAASSR